MIELILAFGAGVVVAGVAFIVFYKNNMNKITKARTAIVDAYNQSGLSDVASKIEAEFQKHFG